MKKLFFLAIMALTLIACEERDGSIANFQTNDKQKHQGTASKDAPDSPSDGQDPAIIVPPRR